MNRSSRAAAIALALEQSAIGRIELVFFAAQDAEVFLAHQNFRSR